MGEGGGAASCSTVRFFIPHQASRQKRNQALRLDLAVVVVGGGAEISSTVRFFCPHQASHQNTTRQAMC